MKDKNEKQKDLDDLKKTLEENKNLFVTGYEKLTVSQDLQLRKTIRDAGGKYRRQEQSGGEGGRGHARQ
jgi:large subunit ribosomal protein L10